jgi:site-specific DNA-methyltransferase (adenine-specific)
MRTMPDNSVDFIVTDSPYGISFMNKGWDHQIPSTEYWQEMLRICKPGSTMACAGLPRMIHRLGCIIEDSGWIIRDMIMHLFGSGFPKSHNHFGLEGYGTALKPSWEGWLLCMKPLDGTYAQNAQKWGLAGINIDDSRIGNDEIKTNGGDKFPKLYGEYKTATESIHKGRWPANLILSEESAHLLDQQSGFSKSGKNGWNPTEKDSGMFSGKKRMDYPGHNDSGGASRFFYCAKASSAERNKGLDKPCSHPTVKPIALMKYIIKLLAPPGTPICLDPFMGSGTTGIACKHLDINFIGIEKEEDYCNIAKARIQNG